MPIYDLVCPDCNYLANDVAHSIHHPHPPCPTCGKSLQNQWKSVPNINPDDIPGGVLIRHGICNPDGSPKKYYSYSEIREAAYQKGLVHAGDTPRKNARLEDLDGKTN